MRNALLSLAVACGLGACTSIDLRQPAPVVDSVPAKAVGGTADTQAPNVPPQPPPAASAVAEPVAMPDFDTGAPAAGGGTAPLRIGLLLPSRMLVQVSDAVRAGFMAAHQQQPGNVIVNLIETGDAPQDVLAGYQQAAAGNDIIVGPLTRSGAVAIVQEKAVTKPTIALTQLNAVGEPEVTPPSNLLGIGLSIEDEARQVADWASRRPARNAFVVTTNASWQRRAAAAFAMQWRSRGGEAELMQLTLTDGYFDAAGLLQLKKRLQTDRPGLLFVALDASQAAQLRSAIGNEVDMVGTSQLNPLSLPAWDAAEPLMSMNDVRLVDMPWQLQADHPAVMAYPRPSQEGGLYRSADLERLYALGIDAYRIARNIAEQQTDFRLDGVTGNLTVHFGQGLPKFDRVEQAAVYRDGKVQALDAQ
jgi:hypothetical protein